MCVGLRGFTSGALRFPLEKAGVRVKCLPLTEGGGGGGGEGGKGGHRWTSLTGYVCDNATAANPPPPLPSPHHHPITKQKNRRKEKKNLSRPASRYVLGDLRCYLFLSLLLSQTLSVFQLTLLFHFP